jgi:endonuclease/exonuclease/phosphatase family metal-dependent hydrolase
LDHILLSQTLEAADVRVLDHLFSDHLPIAVDLPLPAACLAAIQPSV